MAGEGKIWFTTKSWKSNFDKIKEPLYIKEIHFGKGGSTYFRGSISELNLFSKTFTMEDLVTLHIWVSFFFDFLKKTKKNGFFCKQKTKKAKNIFQN